MSIVFRCFRNLMRIICISACTFCVFIGAAISSNNLPSGYTELEYIETTGKQHINTNINFFDSLNYKINLDVSFNEWYDYQGIFTNTTHSMSYESWVTVYGTPSLRIGGQVYRSSVVLNKNTKYNFIYSNTDGSNNILNIIHDGTIVDTLTSISSATTSDYSLVLFVSAGDTDSKAKWYRVSIEKNDVLMGNFIPARRNSDYVVGMYDTVSNTFFTNAGTGKFIAGPVLEIEIATTKYVETAFAGSVSELNTTMGTIKNVVDNTIIQADRIGKLATGKQTRPTGSCPEGRMCLLITESDGTLRWYPICGPDGSVEPFDSNAFLTAFTSAGKPIFKATQDSDSKWTYYNGFFKGMGSWRQQYADGSTSTYDRPFAHTTRCTNPSYTTNAREASPCYTETGMYKTLTEGEWAVVYEGDEKSSSASTTVDPGVIYGISKCVSTNLTGSVSFATKATSAQLADPLFSGIPTNQTDGADYKQCWCKMTAIGLPGSGTTTTEKAVNGGIASVSGSAWVFYLTIGSAAGCANDCANGCANYVRLDASFRSAVVSTNN